MKACDSANNCSASSETKFGFPDGKFDVPPELMTQPVVSDITTTRATITWSTNRGADSRIAYGLGSQNYLPEEPSRSNLTTSHSINLINLTPGTTYYFKAILECNDITASYEPNFTTAPISNPNAAIKVVDVFVAMDRETGKSRGFGFVTLEMPEDESSMSLFTKIIELVNKRIMMGIRGPRELIVNEAEPRVENGNGAPREERSEQPAEETEESGVSLDW